MDWSGHQAWERDWWAGCINTFAEESKQISYAFRMGLVVVPDPTGNERWPMYDLGGRSVLDIGGGPCSLLLKTFNAGPLTVADPCDYPEWIADRYLHARIDWRQLRGEDLLDDRDEYDEVWVYNCLQHVADPARIAANALRIGKTVRVFEWLDVGVCPGHPHDLHADDLDEWYQGRGTVEMMRGENACYGKAYYGVFGSSPREVS